MYIPYALSEISGTLLLIEMTYTYTKNKQYTLKLSISL
jgi:hypothetical protein